jgi:hypothetical protein
MRYDPANMVGSKADFSEQDEIVELQDKQGNG